MARPRAASYDDQRAAILSRAAALFAERGYHAATMLDVAAASGVSKATLYHYFRDKRELLFQIASEHVARLDQLVASVQGERLAAQAELARLIETFMAAYASAQSHHRVLTEDVKFLLPRERAKVHALERRVVAAFAAPIARLRPDLVEQATALAMLLLGMINWTFTWLKPEGPITHAGLAPMVVQLFLGGLPAVMPAVSAARPVRHGARRPSSTSSAAMRR